MRNYGGLARWPLLLGAIILFVLALWEESHDTGEHTTVAVVSVTVGAVLLGAWIYSVAIEAERKHHDGSLATVYRSTSEEKETPDDRQEGSEGPGSGG